MRFPDISIRSRAYALFATLFFASAFNFGLMIYLESVSKEDFYWVNQTREDIEMSATLLTYLTDAETGQRGFLLTSKSEYLDPHYTGVIKSRDLLAQLKEKNFEHPIQLERLANIESLVDAKFVELQQTIDLNRIGKKEEALDIVMSDLGQALMDEMRRELEAFKLEEEQLLFERRTRFTSIRNTIQTIFIIEVSVFTLVLIFLGIVVSQTILKPLSMLQETAKTFKETGYFEPVDIKSKDEIGSLAQALNTMGQKVTELLVDLDSTAKQAMIERDIAIEQAISDPLTGLSNRRFMEVELESLMLSSHRYEHALSIIMFDIDHFKQINDTFGHPVGDVVLQALGKLVKQETRGGDLSIRYGGEEFMLVLTHTNIDGAQIKAESLRREVEKTHFPELNGESVTVSLGITQLKTDDQSISQLIHRADDALYEAKHSGRNCWKTH